MSESIDSSRTAAMAPFLIDDIRRNGPMPFERYMDLCLYHPQHGYYGSGDLHVGRYGDFYTNVSVSSLFGQLIGREFINMWRHLGSPVPFVICEQGANNGQFAVDVLSWMREWEPELFASCAYWFVEPQPSLKAAQEAKVRESGLQDHAFWVADVADLPGDAFTGIFFSNELVDSFPTHRVVFRDGVWNESLVDWDERKGVFSFTNRPLEEGHPLAVEAVRWKLPRIQNYTAEICLRASSWIRHLGEAMSRGFVMTVDYGYPADILYDYNRIDGTICCYHRHKKNYDPLRNPGDQDITAHVNFSQLMAEGEVVGLETLGLVDQHRFMVGVAQDDYLALQEQRMRENPDDPQVREGLRAFRALMHPEMMGTTFKFLIQAKGFDEPPVLSGLRHGRAGDLA